MIKVFDRGRESLTVGFGCEPSPSSFKVHHNLPMMDQPKEGVNSLGNLKLPDSFPFNRKMRREQLDVEVTR